MVNSPLPAVPPGGNTLPAPPRVVLADDHPDFLEETRSLLEPDCQVVFAAKDADSLLQAVRESKPDIVITDFRMPGRNGIDASLEIIRRGLCNAVILLSLYCHPELIRSALEGGIRGYVLKDDAGEELLPAVRAVLSGGCYLSGGVACGRD